MKSTTLDQLIKLQEQLTLKQEAVRAAESTEDKLALTWEADDIIRRINDVKHQMMTEDHKELAELYKQQSQGKY